MSHRRGDWGHRSFSQPPFQGSGGGVNPWGQGSGMDNQRALLSQITSNPQQLALALSNLLQPQDHNPPSLLSLHTPSGMQGNYYNSSGRLGAVDRGRDFRRHEPYNRNRNPGGFRNGAKGRNKRSRDKKQGKDKKNDVKKTVKNKDETADTAVDASVDEDKDETKESKRAWKDEKNQNDEKNESESEGDKTEKKDDASAKDGKYVGVPIQYLNCFVCNKVMWDGVSMWKHIKGMAHEQMLKRLEENMQITANVLRENMRLNEEKKLIERRRMRRLKQSRDFDGHCNMCDLKIFGKISVHRRSPAHQRLKRYLHPDCDVCNKEFHGRIDWVEHRLTPEHLKKLTESNDGKLGGPDGMDIFKDDEGLLESLLEETLEMEADNPILELDAPLENLQNMMPSYKKDRPVATKCLEQFSGFNCTLCHRAFKNEEEAQEHLKTQRHYYKFVGIIKEKHRQENLNKDKKKAEEEEAVEKDGEEDKEMYNPEEVTNEDEDDDGNEETVAKDDEISMDTSQLQNGEELTEDNTEETLVKIEDVKEEAISDDEKQEEVTPPPPAPVVVEVKKPTTAAPATRIQPQKRNVKNDAGPKSKRGR